MDDHSEIERLSEQVGDWSRTDFHDFRNSISKIGVVVAVIEARQTANTEWIREIREASKETNDLLRKQNGRIASVETRVAVLDERTGEATAQGGKSGRNMGVLFGSIVAGLVSALWQIFGGSK